MFAVAWVAIAAFIYYIFTGQEYAFCIWSVLTFLLIYFA